MQFIQTSTIKSLSENACHFKPNITKKMGEESQADRINKELTRVIDEEEQINAGFNA